MDSRLRGNDGYGAGMTVVRGVSIGGRVVRALRYAPVKAPALLRVIGLQGRQRDSRLRGNDGCGARMTVSRGFHWREGCARPSIRAGQSPGATQGDRVARASSVDSRLRGNDGYGAGMTVARGVSFGGRVVRALRYAPVKAPALLRVIGLQGRQRWIPAFAGMTVVHARMTVVQRPPFTGMTVARESRFVETTVKGRADRRRDAESSSERR